jgi:hypothetical protein
MKIDNIVKDKRMEYGNRENFLLSHNTSSTMAINSHTVKSIKPCDPLVANFQGKFSDKANEMINFFFCKSAKILLEDENEYLIGFAISSGHGLEDYLNNVLKNATKIQGIKCHAIRLTKYTDYLYSKIKDPITGALLGHIDFSIWAVLAYQYIAIQRIPFIEPNHSIIGSAMVIGIMPKNFIQLKPKEYVRYAPWLHEKPDLLTEINNILKETSGKLSQSVGNVLAQKDGIIAFDGSTIHGMSGSPLIESIDGNAKVCGLLISGEAPDMYYEAELMAELCEKLGSKVFNDPLAARIYHELVAKAYSKKYDLTIVETGWSKGDYQFANSIFFTLQRKLICANNKEDSELHYNICLDIRSKDIQMICKKCEEFVSKKVTNGSIRNYSAIIEFFVPIMTRDIYVKLISNGGFTSDILEELEINIVGDDSVNRQESTKKKKFSSWTRVVADNINSSKKYDNTQNCFSNFKWQNENGSSKDDVRNFEETKAGMKEKELIAQMPAKEISIIKKSCYSLKLDSIRYSTNISIEVSHPVAKSLLAKTTDIHCYFLGAYACCKYLEDGSICITLELPNSLNKANLPAIIELA